MKVEVVTTDFNYGGTWLMNSHYVVEAIWTTSLQLKVKYSKMAITLQSHCSHVFVMLLYVWTCNMTNEWQRNDNEVVFLLLPCNYIRFIDDSSNWYDYKWFMNNKNAIVSKMAPKLIRIQNLCMK
jgi:hypothetical protein